MLMHYLFIRYLAAPVVKVCPTPINFSSPTSWKRLLEGYCSLVELSPPLFWQAQDSFGAGAFCLVGEALVDLVAASAVTITRQLQRHYFGKSPWNNFRKCQCLWHLSTIWPRGRFSLPSTVAAGECLALYHWTSTLRFFGFHEWSWDLGVYPCQFQLVCQQAHFRWCQCGLGTQFIRILLL